MRDKARKALAAFGDMDRETAKMILSMWAGYKHLSRKDVAIVLRMYPRAR